MTDASPALARARARQLGQELARDWIAAGQVAPSYSAFSYADWYSPAELVNGVGGSLDDLDGIRKAAEAGYRVGFARTVREYL